MSQNQLSHDAYTVGWVCVVDYEQDAAREMLDEEHDDLLASPGDENIYILGRMGNHNVAIVRPPGMGLASAARVVTNMTHTFPSIRFGLMVGIGGGATDAPQGEILLGDVVVSTPKGSHPGVFQYDMGKIFEDGFHIESHLNKPVPLLTAAALALGSDHRTNRGKWKDYICDTLQKLQSYNAVDYSYPGRQRDVLYQPEYHHSEGKKDCSDCGPGQAVLRSSRDEPRAHYGLIASANSLMRSAKARDKLAKEHGVLCFEMEAAGLMDGFPCIIIRGICDYSDSHKNEIWQPYASVTAAAYAKDLLRRVQPDKAKETEPAADFVQKYKKDMDKVKSGVSDMNIKFDADRRSKILNWLTPLDFREEQARLFKDYVPIRRRILETEEFKRWMKGSHWQFRCYGEAGTGKTYLCASIVQYLQDTTQSCPVLYIYLDDNKREEQTPKRLLGSLLRQLVEFDPATNILSTLSDAYDSRSIDASPNEDMIKETFQNLLQRYQLTYLIVDGVNQCDPKVPAVVKDYPLSLVGRNYNLSLLTTSMGYRETATLIMCDVCQKGDLKIFFNCACNGRDYDLCLECKNEGKTCPRRHKPDEVYDTVRVELRASDDEITMYCLHRLQKAAEGGEDRRDPRVYPSPRHNPSGVARYLYGKPELQKKIARRIAKKTRSNFIIARSWIDNMFAYMLELQNDDELLARSDTAPIQILKGYCKDRINSILHYATYLERDQTIAALCLIACASPSLTMKELQHALAIRRDTSHIMVAERDHRTSILKTANGLITVDHGDEAHSYVRLFHGAVYEVLHDCDHGELKRPHSTMASLCLTYLQHSEVLDHYKEIQEWPLLPYAVLYWGDHVREACANGDDEIEVQARQFLRKQQHFKASLKAYASLCSIDSAEWIYEGVDVLHVCAWFGLSGLIRKLGRDKYDVNALEPRYKRTPLKYACVRGNAEAVHELLQLHATVENVALANVICGLPLAGDSSPHEGYDPAEIIGALLETENLDINAGLDARASTALMLAFEKMDLEIAERLLKVKSIDIDAQDSKGRTALSYLIFACRQKPCWLTDWPAPIVAEYIQKLLSLLLKSGADPNIRDDCRYTALELAVCFGQFDNVSILLQCPQTNLHCSKSLIHIASQKGWLQMIPLLHNAMSGKCRGYSIDAQDEGGLTPLHNAFKSPRAKEIIEVLLDLGADPSVTNKKNPTPYELAIALGRDDIVERIEDKCHKLEPHESRKRHKKNPPAIILAYCSRWDLLENAIKAIGSDLKQNSNDGCTLLHVAAARDQAEIVRTLLQGGHFPPPCTARDSCTPLHWAKSKHVAGLLIKYGFDVNYPDIEGNTPLSTALQKRLPELATYLIEAGADIYGLRVEMQQLLLGVIGKGCVDAVDNIRYRKSAFEQCPQSMGIRERTVVEARHGVGLRKPVEWLVLLRQFGWPFALSLALIMAYLVRFEITSTLSYNV